MTFRYTDFKGRLKTRTIGVNNQGRPLQEHEAIFAAENSLRKTFIVERLGKKYGEWTMPPKVEIVSCRQRWQGKGIERTVGRYEMLRQRYRDK